jgi:hypothetical protein
VHLYCTDTNTLSKRTETRFHMTHSSRNSIGCVQDDFRSDGTFDTNHAPFLHREYHCLQTDSNKLPLEPRHLGVLSGASKMISEPMVRLAQTVHLYYTDTNTVSKRTETRFHMTHSLTSSIGCVQDDFLSDGTFDTNRAPFLQCDYRYRQTDSNKLPLEPRHLRVSSGASKMSSDPMVCLAQIVHLYCTDTNTLSKWNKMRFHMTHSPRSSIGCVPHDFRADGTFNTNRAPFLRQDYPYLQTDSNKLPLRLDT